MRLLSFKRIADLDLKETDDAFAALNAAEAAEQRFRHGINEYAERCRGSVLPLKAGDLARRMFDAYFSTSPPFGIRKDKKSEFPDAACLFSLEDFARELPGKGILVSADKGWAAFAEESEHLYCVQTIEDLTKLFAATDEHGQAIKAHVTAAINDADSPLHEEIKTAIDVHLDAADWSVDEIYTSSVARVEGEAHSSTLVSYELDPASTSIWAVENEPTSWVVEVSALVKSKVQISATFFVWDSIDREELELTSAEIVVEHDAEIPIYLTCHGVHSGANPSDWDIEVEIGSGKYEVDVGEVDPDFSDDWHG